MGSRKKGHWTSFRLPEIAAILEIPLGHPRCAALFVPTVVAFGSMSAAAPAARLAQGEPATMLKPLFAATAIQMLFIACCARSRPAAVSHVDVTPRRAVPSF